MSKEMNIEEAISRLKIIHDYKKQVYDMEEMKPVIVFELPNEDRKAIETVLANRERLEKECDSKEKAYNDCYCEYKHYKQFESISKDKIRDRQMQREFELQQEYKDFGDDVEWNIYQKLLKGSE